MLKDFLITVLPILGIFCILVGSLGLHILYANKKSHLSRFNPLYANKKLDVRLIICGALLLTAGFLIAFLPSNILTI